MPDEFNLIKSSAYIDALRHYVAPKMLTLSELANLSTQPSCTERPTATNFSALLPRWGLQ